MDVFECKAYKGENDTFKRCRTDLGKIKAQAKAKEHSNSFNIRARKESNNAQYTYLEVNVDTISANIVHKVLPGV